MRIRRDFYRLPVLFFGIFLTACTQDPLFYDISTEYPPIESIIGGEPTDIVQIGDILYVANNASLWYYDTTGSKRWQRMGKGNSGDIKAIAATPSAVTPKLYLLDYKGNIFEYDPGTSTPPGEGTWGSGSSRPVDGIQQIYGAADKIFIGTTSTVHESDGTLISGPSGLLSGAVKKGTEYYVSVSGNSGGVYNVTTSTSIFPDSISIKGIIEFDSKLVAVDTGGNVFYDLTIDLSYTNSSVGFSGGMAVWSDSADKLLLLGLRAGKGYHKYGYREMDSTGSVHEPGDDSGGRKTSIDPGHKVGMALGKWPVNFMYVIPSSDSGDSANRPIVLASTVGKGLWAYHVRRGMAQWNGEDNSW